MHIAELCVLLGHLMGWALLFGGAAAQWRRPEPCVSAGMLNGALLLLVTGVVLVILAETAPDPVNHAKLAVKAGVALVVVVLVVANRRWESIPRGLLAIISVLTLANAAVAVLW